MNGTHWLMVLVVTSSCLGAEPDVAVGPASKAASRMDDEGYALDEFDMEMEEMAPMGGAPARPSAKKELRDGKVADYRSAPDAPDAPDASDTPDAPGDAARTREWFPESFMWQPLVITDSDGMASVDFTVPDQLTTWRVLGLAHDRAGSQAGAVHTFDSRLPLYVDPVVPGWLYAGDRLTLPVQVVNTTDESVSALLRTEGKGSLSGAFEGRVSLGAGDSDVYNLNLMATEAGRGVVDALLAVGEDGDRAVREIRVMPKGRPVQRVRGGTLAGERSFLMAGPQQADPSTQELMVQVFPGPMSVLQAEVERLQGGARPDDGGYGFALSAQMSTLAAQTQVDVDPAAVRGLQMVAWQRIVRKSRSPDAGIASDLLSAIKDVEGHVLSDSLRPRLVRSVVAGQRGDGTWARQGQASMQQVLVQTAWAARSLPDSERVSRLRAGGALERYAPQIEDPYTAAVVLASGVASESLAVRLREIVLDRVVILPDGEHTVQVPSGARNPWGYTPTRSEMLAWTSLALADQHALDWRHDFLAEVMSGYDARWGFHAGPADTVALEAIAKGMPALVDPIDVLLTVDGREVARAKVDPAQPKIPAVLITAMGGTQGQIGLRAEPAVPGLAFVATLDSWVPWSGQEQLAGVELNVSAGELRVGRSGFVTLELSAPSGEVITIEQGLPAGCTVDTLTLQGDSQTTQVQGSTDRVRLTTRPFKAGEVMRIDLSVQPAFAGRYSTVPLKVSASSGSEIYLPPMVWKVEGSSGS